MIGRKADRALPDLIFLVSIYFLSYVCLRLLLFRKHIDPVCCRCPHRPLYILLLLDFFLLLQMEDRHLVVVLICADTIDGYGHFALGLYFFSILIIQRDVDSLVVYDRLSIQLFLQGCFYGLVLSQICDLYGCHMLKDICILCLDHDFRVPVLSCQFRLQVRCDVKVLLHILYLILIIGIAKEEQEGFLLLAVRHFFAVYLYALDLISFFRIYLEGKVLSFFDLIPSFDLGTAFRLYCIACGIDCVLLFLGGLSLSLFLGFLSFLFRYFFRRSLLLGLGRFLCRSGALLR